MKPRYWLWRGHLITFFFSSSLYFCWAFLAVAKTHQTSSYPLSSEIKSLRVQLGKANLRLIPLKGDKLSIRSKQSLKVTEEDSIMLISEEGFLSVSGDTLTTDKKQKAITIKVPSSLPITVVLVEGALQADKFKNLSVFISHQGRTQIKNTKGQLNISQQSGNINVFSHRGPLKIQAEQAKVQVRACQGEMEFKGFKSQLMVNNSRGQLTVRAFDLPLTLNSFKGRLNFWQEKGDVHLKNVTGFISGYSKEGNVSGLIHPGTVRIETKKGDIRLNVPHSRAWVKVDTWEGRLWIPPYFNRTRTGGVERAQGRLRKGKKSGQVFLKSHSGSIKIH